MTLTFFKETNKNPEARKANTLFTQYVQLTKRSRSREFCRPGKVILLRHKSRSTASVTPTGSIRLFSRIPAHVTWFMIGFCYDETHGFCQVFYILQMPWIEINNS